MKNNKMLMMVTSGDLCLISFHTQQNKKMAEKLSLNQKCYIIINKQLSNQVKREFFFRKTKKFALHRISKIDRLLNKLRCLKL